MHYRSWLFPSYQLASLGKFSGVTLVGPRVTSILFHSSLSWRQHPTPGSTHPSHLERVDSLFEFVRTSFTEVAVEGGQYTKSSNSELPALYPTRGTMVWGKDRPATGSALHADMQTTGALLTAVPPTVPISPRLANVTPD